MSPFLVFFSFPFPFYCRLTLTSHLLPPFFRLPSFSFYSFTSTALPECIIILYNVISPPFIILSFQGTFHLAFNRLPFIFFSLYPPYYPKTPFFTLLLPVTYLLQL